jgi:hypothetical protein
MGFKRRPKKARWRFVSKKWGVSGAPQLRYEIPYQPDPDHHAFPNLVVTVEGLPSRSDKNVIEFYVDVSLQGLGPSLGQAGWTKDAADGVVAARIEATVQAKRILEVTTNIPSLSTALIKRLRDATIKYWKKPSISQKYGHSKRRKKRVGRSRRKGTWGARSKRVRARCRSKQ